MWVAVVSAVFLRIESGKFAALTGVNEKICDIGNADEQTVNGGEW